MVNPPSKNHQPTGVDRSHCSGGGQRSALHGHESQRHRLETAGRVPDGRWPVVAPFEASRWDS